ncbi:hypothetical protein [Mageeibacillus indolicus]|uniref:Uncharacterized protein n=1 Tax=Mageeibacillus indolicus (strain UPII9-5) TaxID=699246 RepID=D3R1Q0_MAGIU|nr:hypothetical protein [Mageeibacillus indolicus]ADC91551.1 hypothetical protein HMPREF0868_0790 [Mageeibacillus indolicus UPII9-5]KFA57508.1 hypothetical protein HMPREF1632_02415 [Mageeibacillus indolicus 0009-5]
MMKETANRSKSFKELVYQRPDLHRLASRAKVIKSRLQKWNKEANLGETIEDFQATLDEFNEQQTLVAIKWALDVDNVTLARENLFWQQIQPSLQRLIFSVNGWLRSKSALPKLAERWGKKFIWQNQRAHLTVNRSNQAAWNDEQTCIQAVCDSFNRGDVNALILAYRKLADARNRLARQADFPDYLHYIFANDEFFPTYENFTEIREYLRENLVRFLPALQASTELVSASRTYDLSWLSLTKQLTHSVVSGEYDFIFALNSILNRIGYHNDEILGAWHDGFVDILPSPDKSEGVECFYLPASAQPFLCGRARKTPFFILDLLREAGVFQAYKSLTGKYRFTPQILPDDKAKEFIAATSVNLALPYLNVFYGADADLFRHWYLREIVINILQLSMQSEFQERLYADPNLNWSEVSNELLQRYFPAAEKSAADADPDFGHWELKSNFWLNAGQTADLILGQIAALTLQDQSDGKTEKLFAVLQAFVLDGNNNLFKDRLAVAGVKNPWHIENLKRQIFQLCYMMGY